MHVWPKFYGSSPSSFWETKLNAKPWQKAAKSVNHKRVKTQYWIWGWPLLFKMYAWLKFHSSSPHSFWENDLNAETRQKISKSVNHESRSILKTDGWFHVCSLRCLTYPSFMTLALTVSKKLTLTQKLDKNLQSYRTVKSWFWLSIDGRIELHSSRFMHAPSFIALANIVS